MADVKRILSIDGGGIKGVLPAAFLATIEEATGKSVVDHFDLIAGTSTGGIIAIGLGLGMTAADVLRFYEEEGPAIFSQADVVDVSLIGKLRSFCRTKALSLRRVGASKYDPAALKGALERAFGDRKLGDSKTRLLIPAFDRQRRDVHVFKTSHHERFRLDWKERAVDVALATAAAPTYLPGHRLDNGISLIDGGVWANNPLGLAAVEAVGVLGWPGSCVYALSIGCTDAPVTIPEGAGLAGLALKIADVFFIGQSSGALGTAKLLLGDHDGDKRLFRVQHIASPGEFSLDAVAQIPALKGIGAALARQWISEIDRAFFAAGRREIFSPAHSI